MSFNRMNKRYEQNIGHQMATMMERMTENLLTDRERADITRGPSELDYVYSALAETMSTAYQHVYETWKTYNTPDLRTAAFLFSLDRVATSYVALGIFP
jgi:glutamate dehydrogenase (NAD(P)+)